MVMRNPIDPRGVGKWDDMSSDEKLFHLRQAHEAVTLMMPNCEGQPLWDMKKPGQDPGSFNDYWGVNLGLNDSS